MKRLLKIDGMKKFTMIWFGQFVSIMGTAMTKFALSIWAYQQSGKATTMALLLFFSYVPYILLSPLAGSVVDKIDRKTVLVLSDVGAALVTVFLLLMQFGGNLSIWHLYLAEVVVGSLEAFQIPAYISSISLLIPKDQYSRASGMRSFSSSTSQVFAPIIAGFMLVQVGIRGIMYIDLMTFLVAMGTLLVVKIPNPVATDDEEKKMSTWQNLKFSMNYLLEKRGLFWLLIVFVFINLIAAMTYFGILPAMVLARSGNNEMIWAVVQSTLGIGGVVGSLIVSIWGVPEKKVMTILITLGLSFAFGDMLFAVGKTVYVWVIAAFLTSVFLPFMLGASDSLWQAKVEPHLQGRIFAVRGMFRTSCMPLGYILGGFFADYIFEPALTNPTLLNKMFGWMVGTTKGSGMAFMFVLSSVLGVTVCIFGYLNKHVRYLEENIADHDIVA